MMYTRRSSLKHFLLSALSAKLMPFCGSSLFSSVMSDDGAEGTNSQQIDRATGLLWGSLIGDAMGGPLEFAKPHQRKGRVIGCRQWPDARRLDAESISEIAKQATLMSYQDVRPEPADYGPWVPQAPAGTITDDSRFKIIFVRAVRLAAQQQAQQLTEQHLAKAIIDFSPHASKPPNPRTQQLLTAGLREYRYAANWVLGERDPEVALPLERLWSGIPNCSGQMLLLPVALQYAGQPETAYLRTYQLDFVDAAGAKDIAAAIVAGLAAVIGPQANSLSTAQRWNLMETTIRTVDPYRLTDVPFAGRPLHKWLNLVDSIVERSQQRPAIAYRLLEEEGKPDYYWDAHFTLVVALTLLKLSKYDTLCALQLAIDFGHDTDSYAQLLGAMAGAVNGTLVFPSEMRTTVAERLEDDYAEDVSEWTKLLLKKKQTP